MSRRPRHPEPRVELPTLHPLVAALAFALPLQTVAQTVRPTTVPAPAPAPLPGWRVQPMATIQSATKVSRDLPAVDPNALPRPADQWVTTGSATASQSAAQLTVSQASQRAIYQWASFDIGANATVRFDMAQGGSSALNRVFSGAPTQIFGKLQATNGGELYLINANGVLFGRNARVDVGALIASTLNISDAEFKSGLVNTLTTNNNVAAFRYEGRPEDFIDTKNFVRVDEGAQITTAEGGRVFLFAKRVENAGTITTPGGQTVLAAGSEVAIRLPTQLLGSEETAPLYAAESNPKVPVTRGLLVEVGDRIGGARTPNGDGGVVNESTGVVKTPRGNTTFVGMAVNQEGRVSASTSVAESGSVLLLAQGGVDTAVTGQNEQGYKRASRTGTLVIGAGSITEVMPSDAGADGKRLTSDDNATFVSSRIEMTGRSVVLEPQARVAAPGGTVNLRAVVKPEYRSDTLQQGFRPNAEAIDASVTLAAGAVIDVSGTTTATESAARHFVTTELLGSNDLKDAPLQRDGILYRNRVTVDTRGTSPILGDLATYRAGEQRAATERLSEGGTVNIRAEGRVTAEAGSRIDVSGGRVSYTEAVVRPTRLVAQDGTLYTLNDAPADHIYTRIVDNTRGGGSYDRFGPVVNWGGTTGGQVERAYVDGKDAGTLGIVAPTVQLGGTLAGAATQGRRQLAGSDPLARGGDLSLGAFVNRDPFGGASYGGAVLRDLSIEAAARATGGDGSRVSTQQIAEGGFADVTLVADAGVQWAPGARLDLPALSTVQVLSRSGTVEFAGAVNSSGGTVRVQSLGGDVRLNGASIDVSGAFVNQALDGPRSTASIRGGTVTVSAGRDVVMHGSAGASRIDASGGAAVSASGAVSGGDGGSITLSADLFATTPKASGTGLDLGESSLSAHSLARGGSLSLTTRRVRVGDDGPAADGVLVLAPGFFSQGGFNAYSLNGRASLEIADGTQLAPQQARWQAGAGLRLAPSGTKLGSVVSVGTSPLQLPNAVNLSFASGGYGASLPDGRVRIGEGVGISLAPQARLSVSAATALEMQGQVVAPGGSVSLGISRSANGDPGAYEVPTWLLLGEGSRIDVSGTTVVTPTTNGLRSGRVLDGGSVTLQVGGSMPGQLIWQHGAEVRADGASGQLDVTARVDGAVRTTRQTVNSAGGTVTVAANRDLVIEGSVSAAGGLAAGQGEDRRGLGGTLAVSLRSAQDTPQSRFDTRTLQVAPEQTAATAGQDAAALGRTPLTLGGSALLPTPLIDGAGLGRVSLSSFDTVALQDGVTLGSPALRELRIDATAIAATGAAAMAAGQVVVTGSPHPNLNDPSNTLPVPAARSGGDAALTVRAGNLVLEGNVAMQGVGTLNLQAREGCCSDR